jgi:integrase
VEELRHRIEDGRHEIKPKGERRTFAEMTEEYLVKKADKRSLGRDRESFKKLGPFFGTSFLHAITRNDVERYKIERREKVSGATVNRELALLRHLFNIAIDEGYTRENPARRVKMFKEQKCKRRSFVYSEYELQALVNAAAPHLRAILAVAIGTGLRKGDLLGLRWNQVDFEHNVITLFMQKTEEAIEIPMLPMVRDVLLRLREAAGQAPYVFIDGGGKKIIDIRTAFAGAIDRAGLGARGYTFHDIRRTFATMLFNRGVHLTKIQRLLGHTSVLTTERYLGVKFEETALAIAVLNIPALQALAAPNLSTICAQSPIPLVENITQIN